MSGINMSRVVVGGLVAGVVANALDFAINTYLMADEMADMSQRLNLMGIGIYRDFVHIDIGPRRAWTRFG